MAQVDLSQIAYLTPLYSFVLVFVILFAILLKTKLLGDNKVIISIVSLIIGVIFVSVSDVRSYIEAVTPWFSVLIIALFFVLFLVGFAIKKPEDIIKPWFVWIFIAILVLIFIIIASSSFGSNTAVVDIRGWLTKGTNFGSIALVVVAAVAIFAVTRK